MIYCSNCGTQVDHRAAFCPNCGTSLVAQSGAAGSSTIPAGTAIVAAPYAGQTEEIGRRIVAFLIDIVPMLLLALVHFVPIVGWMFYGLLHALYWLLRDINGASPGKSVMGSYVASAAGGPSTTSQRIIRNIPLAIPGFLGMIPLLGIVLEFFVALAIFGCEALILLTTGRRVGDRLAGTTVLRK